MSSETKSCGVNGEKRRRLTYEFLVRACCALIGVVITGTIMHVEHWIAYFKDAPSRAEVRESIMEDSPWRRDQSGVLAILKSLETHVIKLDSKIESSFASVDARFTRIVTELSQLGKDVSALDARVRGIETAKSRERNER